MKILVIGESCRDIFNYGDCTRLCPEAPVPIFNSIETIENGGMALNVQNNIYALGAEAELYTNKNWAKITKTRFIDIRTNHMFMRLDCNDQTYDKFNIKNVKFDEYDAVVISDYNKGFLTKEDIKQISLNHDCVFLDTKKSLGSWCKGIEYIKINEREYDNNKEYITNEIKDKIITTLGPKGSVYKDTVYSVPKVEIKDVAGAGDSFISGLVVQYMKTKDIEEAIVFANECATKVVQKRGVSTI
jgi:D-beta-D-heptose 7-phosphate kinase/D-beta-D-heptose 1-phosphate adenosyltransferase